jgi:hypothetical protein
VDKVAAFIESGGVKEKRRRGDHAYVAAQDSRLAISAVPSWRALGKYLADVVQHHQVRVLRRSSPPASSLRGPRRCCPTHSRSLVLAVQERLGRKPNGPDGSFPHHTVAGFVQLSVAGLSGAVDFLQTTLARPDLAQHLLARSAGNEHLVERFFAGFGVAGRTGADRAPSVAQYLDSRGELVMRFLQQATFCGFSLNLR